MFTIKYPNFISIYTGSLYHLMNIFSNVLLYILFYEQITPMSFCWKLNEFRAPKNASPSREGRSTGHSNLELLLLFQAARGITLATEIVFIVFF